MAWHVIDILRVRPARNSNSIEMGQPVKETRQASERARACTRDVMSRGASVFLSSPSNTGRVQVTDGPVIRCHTTPKLNDKCLSVCRYPLRTVCNYDLATNGWANSDVVGLSLRCAIGLELQRLNASAHD